MGEDDRSDIRRYYLSPFVHILNNDDFPKFKSCDNDYPDGKANRRENRRRKLRKRKGRL